MLHSLPRSVSYARLTCLLAICCSQLSTLPTALAEDKQTASQQATDNRPTLPVGVIRQLESLCDGHEGDVAVAVKIFRPDGKGFGQFERDADRVQPTASLIKLPIMLEYYRQVDAGKLSPTELIELKEDDKVPGSGILTEHFSAGAQLPLEDVVRLMIRYSDNTATNLVLDAIGLESTAATMKKLGWPETQAHSQVYRRSTSIAPERSRKYGLGSTTARDMLEILVALHRSKLTSTELDSARPKHLPISDGSRRKMLAHLARCDDDTKLGRNLPADAKLANKTGAVSRVRTDAGIIGYRDHTIVAVVLTANNADSSWTDRNAAERLCGRIGQVLTSAIPRPASTEPEAKSLGRGATGFMVEALQRTLNDRIKAGLGVDGDFGPATESAVQKFQQTKGIEATGVVDDETWSALGQLITKDDPVPPPSVVNAEVLPRTAPLDPAAAPEVSAKAWALYDLTNGKMTAGKAADERLHIASTTKVMTAYVVLKWAASHPDCLDETVTYSARADNTLGSTSAVRAGEQLSVRETLYGLLLPSGNDASVALAEHFGQRVSGSEKELTAEGAYEAFIAAMNDAAKELGMEKSHFENTHGLTASEHKCSAADLVLLAKATLEYPLFRTIIQTRQRGCTLVSKQGYRRDVVWKNTNRLLGQEGFYGVKTGTTSAAGACLISLSKIDGIERILVTLGSTNSDARYIDARNLHAWALRQ